MEYARWLGFDLCFQDFDREYANLPGEYAPPEGRLLIAEMSAWQASAWQASAWQASAWHGHPARVESYEPIPVGVVALHKFGEGACEMKRLFVKPEFRGRGIGRALVERVIEEARLAGYRTMRLDTIGTMEAAIGIYLKVGFREIPPYRFNPIEGARFFEREL